MLGQPLMRLLRPASSQSRLPNFMHRSLRAQRGNLLIAPAISVAAIFHSNLLAINTRQGLALDYR